MIFGMDMMNRFKRKYCSIIKSRNYRLFSKFGAPMFVFVVGGSYLMQEFQVIRFNFLEKKRNQEFLTEYLKQNKIEFDMKKEYEKVKNADTRDYKNIRGPRVYEDNKEFLKNRELQEKRLAAILADASSTTSSKTSS